MHPDTHLALHHSRAAELRAEAGAHSPVADTRRPRLRARLGWTLVEVGLRLATRPGAAAPAH
ncbi:hypothetical protein [Streptomyces sp. NRRL S-481]|uniref:hypothetical protein n=1 Tax=Streptomyces sp. NRRL S-481 TaxID=1463911 RepID=UPI0004C7E89A|nr:hypothetical protein [Streptomyces sp. NRRL S-481]